MCFCQWKIEISRLRRVLSFFLRERKPSEGSKPFRIFVFHQNERSKSRRGAEKQLRAKQVRHNERNLPSARLHRAPLRFLPSPDFFFCPCPIHSYPSLVSVKKGPTPTGRSPLFVQTNRVLKFAFTPRDDFVPQSAVGSAPRSTAFLPRFRPHPATGSTERLSPPRSRLCRELPMRRGSSRLP